MKRTAIVLALLGMAAFFVPPTPAEAQLAYVVTSCPTTRSTPYTLNTLVYLTVDVNGTLCTNATGGGGGGLSVVDEAPFTYGTSPFTPGGGFYNSAITPLTSGQQGAFALTPNRSLHTLDDNSAAALAALQGPIPTQVPTVSIGGVGIIDSGGTNKAAVSALGGVAIVSEGTTYNTVAASQTAQALTGGGGGATGDYLSHCTIVPATTAPGVVTILDNSTAIYSYPGGGTTALTTLVPFTIPVGALSTTGAWKVTTGANVSVVCVGKFH